MLTSIENCPRLKVRARLEHEDNVRCVGWSTDGTRLATGAEDGSVVLWRVYPDRTEGIPKHRTKHGDVVTGIAWQPSGGHLASCSKDQHVLVMDTMDGAVVDSFASDRGQELSALAWDPEGEQLVIAESNGDLVFWDLVKNRMRQRLIGHEAPVDCIAWSPDSSLLATGARNGTIGIWRSNVDNQLRLHYAQHSRAIRSLRWSADSRTLVSASMDGHIRVWEVGQNRGTLVLGPGEEPITGAAISPDGGFILAQAHDDTLRVWRTRDRSEILKARFPGALDTPLEPSPAEPGRIALWDPIDRATVVVDVDLERLSHDFDQTEAALHVAKVAVLGPAGSGKTSLARALAEGAEPVGSSVTKWAMPRESRAAEETGVFQPVLWDCCQQELHRSVQQMQIRGSSLALLVFDLSDPEGSLQTLLKWAQVLGQVCGRGVPKILVGTKGDAGFHHSEEELEAIRSRIGAECFVEVSVLTRSGVEVLQRRVVEAVPWHRTGRVSTAVFFGDVAQFLKRKSRVDGEVVHHPMLLASETSLLADFSRASHVLPVPDADQARQFSEDFRRSLSFCEHLGLIQRFPDGLVLFEPERFPAYVHALLEAAEDDPDQMGRVLECDFVANRYGLDAELQFDDQNEEQLFVSAIRALLVRCKLAIEVNDADYLVFPTIPKREFDSQTHGLERGELVRFHGPAKTIYTELVVRIGGSTVFDEPEVWENASLFRDLDGLACGFELEEQEDNAAGLTLLYDRDMRRSARSNFRHLVQRLLEKRTSALDVSVEMAPGLDSSSRYDAFLCHNKQDEADVEALSEFLGEQGVRVWIDKQQVYGGDSIEEILPKIREARCAVVFFGPSGVGPFQMDEIAYVNELVRAGEIRVVPVVLGTFPEGLPDWPVWMNKFHFVDMRRAQDRPMRKLVEAILREPEE